MLPSISDLAVEEIKKVLRRIYPGIEIKDSFFKETESAVIFQRGAMERLDCTDSYIDDVTVVYTKKAGVYTVTVKLGITFSESDRGLTSAFLKVLLKIMNFFDAQVMNYTKLYTRACGLGV